MESVDDLGKEEKTEVKEGEKETMQGFISLYVYGGGGCGQRRECHNRLAGDHGNTR